MAARLSGVAVFYATAGGVLLWSGIKGQTIGETVRAVTSGSSSALSAQGSETVGTPTLENTGTGTDTSGAPAHTASGDTAAHTASAKAAQALAQSMAFASGHVSWITGQQWKDWVSLWNQESGWSSTAQNPSSGALGIAQALGHGGNGTAGKYGNEYPSQAANDGDAASQIAWGISYIAQRYGSPSAAWAHEVANGWY